MPGPPEQGADGPGAGFTAGITLRDGTTATGDVVSVDTGGITYRVEEQTRHARWDEIDAVMLATTDHMLAIGGYLFDVAETLQGSSPSQAAGLKRRGARILADAAPRLCPLGDGCGLARPGGGSPPGAEPP